MRRSGDGTGEATVTSRWLRGRFFSLVLIAGLVAALSACVLELQAGGAAFVLAEGHWSRAQKDLAYSLSRYLDGDDPADLAAARRALQVVLGDRAARLGMDRTPMEQAVVRAGLQAGGNRPADIDRLIRMYRHGRHLPYMREAIGYWLQAEPGITRMNEIATALERCAAGTGACPDAAARAGYRRELATLDRRMQPLEEAFSRSIADGIAVVRIATLAVIVLGLLLLTGYAVWTARQIRRHMAADDSRFRAAFHQAAVGMAQLDLSGRVLEANQALASILGHARQDLQQLSLAELLHPDSLARDSVGAIDWQRQLRGGERRFVRSSGQWIWCRWSASEVEHGGPGGRRVLAVVEDVSQARLFADELAYQASHDALTGLINRREIERRLDEVLAGMRRRGSVRHSLCFVDLDHFKLVNDTFGHAAGDAALRRFAALALSRLRPGDWVGRLGGDEFAIFLADTPLAASAAVLEPIRAALAHPDDHFAPLRGSFGVVEIGPQSGDLNSLMTAADLACYASKESGRNHVRRFGSEELEQVRRRREGGWVGQVRLAMAEGRLQLFAQKIVDLDQPRRLRYEVLVRLLDTDGTVRLPGEFLPSIERYGLGDTLDRHVLELLFATLAQLPVLPAQAHLCHVNLSAQSIGLPGFQDFVCELLDRHPQLRHNLCLEITETAVVADPVQARGFIQAVRARGCRVALDDFGNGLASFGYLKQFPADLLKIDGCFVRDLAHDDVDRATVEAIAKVGQALALELVAEGVEDAAALAILEAIGIRSMQGFAIHRPCPLSELLAGSEALA